MMIVLRRVIARQSLRHKAYSGAQQERLYTIIAGDKANENYVTLSPFMDFESTLVDQRHQLELSLAGRNMKMEVTNILEKYKRYIQIREQLSDIEKERQKVVLLIKSCTKLNNTDAGSEALKERGKSLRNDMKEIKETINPVEEDLFQSFLNLPNVLHRVCPKNGEETIIYRSSVPQVENGDTHLNRKDLIRFIDDSRYYMMREAADFDVRCSQAMFRHFVHTGGFLPTANPDFVRRVLLEANATPLAAYHAVVEEYLHNKNGAYLTGGGAFESFLGALTKLSVYPSVLPLRFVSCGRSYERTGSQSADDGTSAAPDLFTATQTNAVQTFVASTSATEADQHMDEILNLAVDFYKRLGLHFRIVYANACALTPAECLRADIEVYAAAKQRYIRVGSVGNYSDFVSKRILFAMRKQKDFHFLYLVGGPVLHTTRLIAALIESGIPLEKCALLGTQAEVQATTNQKAIDQFKNIFQ